MIRTIVHVSDVHIRLNQGFGRLQATIDELKRRLEAYDPKETIVVCTGNVFHSKTSLSPEAVLFARRFFGDLILLGFEVVCIPGYHDGNASDPDRSDAIQTLEPYFENDPRLRGRFHYFRTTGRYPLRNLTFGVGSVFSPDAKPPSAEALESRDDPMFRRVALYHGLVRTAVLPDDRVVDATTALGPEDFRGYDLVLLGHVHRHQFLAENCGYASSLQQQSHQEDPLQHGFVAWDVELCRGTFVAVPAEHQYLTLTVESGAVTSEPALPAQVSFRVRHRDTTPEQLADLRGRYEERCRVVEWKVIRGSDLQSERSHVATMGQDLLNPSRFGRLVQRCFPDRFTPADLERLADLHREFNRDMVDEEAAVRNWNVERLRFSNLFCFEEDNVIDFTALPRNAVVEIFGSNGSGKTSLLDVICFALFGRCTRGANGRAIVRRGAHMFAVTIILRSNGQRYRIMRQGTKMHTSKCKIETFVHQLLDDDRTRPLMLKGQKRINGFIASLVGSYDTFRLTSTLLVNGTRGFLRETNASRKTILQTLLGMSRFADLLTAAKKQRKTLDAKLRKRQIALPARPESADETVTRYREQLATLTGRQTDSEQAIERLTARYRKLTETLETMPVADQAALEAIVASLDQQCRDMKVDHADARESLAALSDESSDSAGSSEPPMQERPCDAPADGASASDVEATVSAEIESLRNSMEPLLRGIAALPADWSRERALSKRTTHREYRDRVAKKVADLDRTPIKDHAGMTDAERSAMTMEREWRNLNQSIEEQRNRIVPTDSDEQSLATERNQLESSVATARTSLAIGRAVGAAWNASAAAQRAVTGVPFMSRHALDCVDKIMREWRQRLSELRQQRKIYEDQLKDFKYDQACQYCVRNNRARIEQRTQLRVVVATIESLEQDLAKKQRSRAHLERCVQLYEAVECAAKSAAASADLRINAASDRLDRTECRLETTNCSIQRCCRNREVRLLIERLDERREAIRPAWEASRQSDKEREMQLELFRGKLERADERIRRIDQQLATDQRNEALERQAAEMRASLERLTTRLQDARAMKRRHENRRTRARLTKHLARLESRMAEAREELASARTQLQKAAGDRERRRECEKQREDVSVDLDRQRDLLRRCVRCRSEVDTRLKLLTEAVKRYDEGQASVRGLERQVRLLRSYESCLDHKQGIPNLIIGTVLPMIERQVNRFLESIADFRLEFRLVPVKQHVEILIHHRDCCYDLTAASSSEQLTCDVVTRTVLARLVNKTHVGNVFMGDEIFSQFDAERRAQIPRLFDHLRQHFDLSLIVTQMDEIRQHVDRRIEIARKPNHWSHVCH